VRDRPQLHTGEGGWRMHRFGIQVLDRHQVRARFEQRFSAERMARNYLQIYAGLVKGELASLAA